MILTAAHPYARLSSTAHGECDEHMKAPPPGSQPEAVSPPSLRGLSLMSQVPRGPWERGALPGQAHEGLQQSQ